MVERVFIGVRVEGEEVVDVAAEDEALVAPPVRRVDGAGAGEDARVAVTLCEAPADEPSEADKEEALKVGAPFLGFTPDAAVFLQKTGKLVPDGETIPKDMAESIIASILIKGMEQLKGDKAKMAQKDKIYEVEQEPKDWHEARLRVSEAISDLTKAGLATERWQAKLSI